MINGIRTDNGDFTSPGEYDGEKFPVSSSIESGGSDGGSDTENELVSEILNTEPYEPVLEGLMSRRSPRKTGRRTIPHFSPRR